VSGAEPGRTIALSPLPLISTAPPRPPLLIPTRRPSSKHLASPYDILVAAAGGSRDAAELLPGQDSTSAQDRWAGQQLQVGRSWTLCGAGKGGGGLSAAGALVIVAVPGHHGDGAQYRDQRAASLAWQPPPAARAASRRGQPHPPPAAGGWRGSTGPLPRGVVPAAGAHAAAGAAAAGGGWCSAGCKQQRRRSARTAAAAAAVLVLVGLQVGGPPLAGCPRCPPAAARLELLVARRCDWRQQQQQQQA
jgi:hypothetical protein